MSMPNNNGVESKTEVYNDELMSRSAPITKVGPIAWVRENLFKTWLDVFLTLGGAFIAVTATVGFVSWAVTEANWWAISFNFRQFMLGRYESAYEWRVILAAIVSVFVCGMALRVWIRKLSRAALITVVALLVMFFVFPAIVIALVPMPEALAAASADRVEIGSAIETPPELLAFIGQADETISVRLVTERVQDDDSLAQLNGFMDATTNLMRTAAINRLNSIERQDELRDLLARDEASTIPLLTESQRDLRQTELSRLEIPEPVNEQFNLSRVGVTVQVLDGITEEPLGPEVRLETADDVAAFTLPADGWYVLRKSIDDGAEGVSILSLDGVYPVLRSTALTAGLDGGATTGFASTYIRMTDNFRLEAPVPQLTDGRDMPFYNIVNNQYRGDRSLDTYLRVYLATFLQKLSYGGFILLMAGTAGYWLALLLGRYSAQLASRLTSYAMLLLPLFIWLMAAGFTIPQVMNTSAFTAAVLFVALMYYAGTYWGRNIPTLIIYGVGVVAIGALPYLIFDRWTGLGLVSAVNLVVFLPALLALLAGSATYGASDVPVVRRNMIIAGLLMLAFYFGPLLLMWSGVISANGSYPDWPLAASDQRRWGGLLLTMILTIFGIIVAFPIGVGLALGRRSNLPAIKYGCTLYIELVRGSPFITVLFMMQLMIPLINPAFSEVPGTMRALVAVIMFSAAYLAENVRGGLQSLPPGQTEAARALGMAAWQITLLITLPQALRAVIPALVGQFIALFKDTSLVAIVGLIDLTGFVNIMAVQAEFIGTRAEGLLFITLIYFVFSYVMSYVSRLLEASGSGSTRRL